MLLLLFAFWQWNICTNLAMFVHFNRDAEGCWWRLVRHLPSPASATAMCGAASNSPARVARVEDRACCALTPSEQDRGYGGLCLPLSATCNSGSSSPSRPQEMASAGLTATKISYSGGRWDPAPYFPAVSSDQNKAIAGEPYATPCLLPPLDKAILQEAAISLTSY
jgi:hypothetical protein